MQGGCSHSHGESLRGVIQWQLISTGENPSLHCIAFRVHLSRLGGQGPEGSRLPSRSTILKSARDLRWLELESALWLEGALWLGKAARCLHGLKRILLGLLLRLKRLKSVSRRLIRLERVGLHGPEPGGLLILRSLILLLIRHKRRCSSRGAARRPELYLAWRLLELHLGSSCLERFELSGR